MYFCYGPTPLFDQTLFSIISLIHVSQGVPDNCRLVVYTDRPAAFAALPVETVETNAAILDQWLDGGDYVHRRKTCALLDALHRFGGSVVLLDSDTYWLHPPARLFARIGVGRACLHLCEGYLSLSGTPSDQALTAQLKSGDYRLDGKPVEVNRRTRMWNTGVIGVHLSSAERIREALELSDVIWASADPNGAYDRKIHHAEQFATGLALSTTRLGEAADCVYHYWPADAKAEFATTLPSLVKAGIDDPSLMNFARIYSRRYRESGPDVMKNKIKMMLRRVAIATNLPIRGVRRSVG